MLKAKWEDSQPHLWLRVICSFLTSFDALLLFSSFSQTSFILSPPCLLAWKPRFFGRHFSTFVYSSPISSVPGRLSTLFRQLWLSAPLQRQHAHGLSWPEPNLMPPFYPQHHHSLDPSPSVSQANAKRGLWLATFTFSHQALINGALILVPLGSQILPVESGHICIDECRQDRPLGHDLPRTW